MHADGMLVNRTKNPEPRTPDVLVTCNDPNLTPTECLFCFPDLTFDAVY